MLNIRVADIYHGYRLHTYEDKYFDLYKTSPLSGIVVI